MIILAIILVGGGVGGYLVYRESQNPTTVQDKGFAVIKQEIESGIAYLLDVRTIEEFDEGHIEGSTSFPLQALQSARYPEAAKGAKIYVYSNEGNRSTSAKAILEKADFGEVINLGSYTKVISMGAGIVTSD